MESTFTASGIRQAGAHHAASTNDAVDSAKAAANAVGDIQLPPLFNDQQRKINDIIGGLAGDLGFLTDLSDNFRERMNSSADQYEHTEQKNVAKTAEMNEESPL